MSEPEDYRDTIVHFLDGHNVTDVSSREFAEWIRELEEDQIFERIEGRFVVYREKGRTVYLEIEF